ncbi:fungal-specific transcription factor domain-containing protein [Aspergillus unguis]
MTSLHSLPALAPFPLEEPLRQTLPLPRRTKQTTACTACKARKSRCGGGHPCPKCAELGTECIFLGALDRRRKYAQRRAEQELVALHQLLDEILDAYEAGDMTRLGLLLSTRRGDRPKQVGIHERALSDERSKSSTGNSFQEPSRKPSLSRSSSSSSSSSSASVGSLDEVDTLTEDPNRNRESRAAGYIGKESEVAWMQKLETEANKLDNAGPQPSIDESVSSMSYHVDYLHIADSSPLEPRTLPPKPWAARLVNIFFTSIAPSFPLISRSLFVEQFHHAFSGVGEPTSKWLAVLNLVFATSSKYYQLANPVDGKDVDDRLFLSRAIALNNSHNLVIEHADLHQVQIDLLLAIYYLASGQVNRSWQTNGRAARSAIALGLNLRALSDQIDPVSNETRSRIWWSIFSLEHLLAGMVGRSPCVNYQAMSQHPPVPYDESAFRVPEIKDFLSNTPLREERLKWTLHANDKELEARNRWFQKVGCSQSLFFFHLVDLSIITAAAVGAVYSLTTVRESGQSSIPQSQEKLKTWVSNLQAPFAFTDGKGQLSVSRDNSAQVSLAMAYYSSQIILSRPCLTRPDIEEGTNIRFPRSRFGNDTADTCVHSGLSLIAVLPDEPSTEWCLKMTPWWCILHFIMQALTVLLIQLSIGSVPSTNQGEKGGNSPIKTSTQDDILGASKKALRWLHHMAKQDPSSRHAFEISNSFIRRIGNAKNLDLSGMPSGKELRSPSSSGFSTDTPSDRQGEHSGQAWRTNVEDGVNWGPDYTISESEYEVFNPPFAADPALFSVDM